MRLSLILLFVIVGSWWIPERGLAYLPQPPKNVMIYCQGNNCSASREIALELKRAGIYSHRVDISSNSRAKKQMEKDLGHCGWGQTRIRRYPVVVVNHRKVMIDPSSEEAVKVCSKPVFSWKAIEKEWFDDKGPAAYIFTK